MQINAIVEFDQDGFFAYIPKSSMNCLKYWKQLKALKIL